MTVVLMVLAAIAVFAIAAVVIGREARRLDAVAPRAVYDVGDAVDHVADHLPAASRARLTPDELRELLAIHLRLLRTKGLQPPKAVDHVQDIAEPVVLDDTGLVGFVIARAEEAGLDVDDADVANVIDAHLDYFDAIGAVGPPAVDPDVRPPS